MALVHAFANLDHMYIFSLFYESGRDNPCAENNCDVSRADHVVYTLLHYISIMWRLALYQISYARVFMSASLNK